MLYIAHIHFCTLYALNAFLYLQISYKYINIKICSLVNFSFLRIHMYMQHAYNYNYCVLFSWQRFNACQLPNRQINFRRRDVMTVNSATFSRRRWRSVYRLVGFSSREVRKSRPSAATENSSFYFTSRHPRLGNCEKVLRQETRAYTGQPIWPVGRGKKRV